MARKRIKDMPFVTTKNLKIIIAGAILIAAAISFYFISIKNKVDKWDNLIYTGVIADGIDLSGKTKEEAKKIIEDNSTNIIGNKEIKVTLDDKVITYHYSDIEATYNVDKIVSDSINYGKDLSLMKKYRIIKGKKKEKILTGFQYNEEKLKELEKNIVKELSVEPKNATININYGNIEITPEESGYTVNSKKLHDKMIKSLNGDVNKKTDIVVEAEKAEPKITKEALSKIQSTPMATYSTSYASSAADRSTNLQIVTGLVNGTLLMPGDEFSYSEVSQRGRGQYLDAAVYVNNKVEQAEAGGICQVSSTLYNAVMRANIRSVERTNHSLTVSYVPYGLDATVAWGYLDYKFKNTYDFPVYIEGRSDNRTITFNIYGDPSALNGVKYELTSNVLETIPPEISYIDDNNLEKGKEVVESTGQTGYKVESFIVGYKNGVEVSREFIDKDTYATTKTVIRRGTKEEPVVNNKEEAVVDNKEENNTDDNKTEDKATENN